MPCSRSARSPSVSSARSRAPSPPRRSLASLTCSSWSSNTCLVSYSSLPLSALLPSSTPPAVVKRSRSSVIGAKAAGASSEVPGLLAVLHGGLGNPVVRPRLAALGHPRGGDLEHDLVQRGGLRAHAARAAHVADRAVADRVRDDLLAVDQLGVLAPGVEHPVAAE